MDIWGHTCVLRGDRPLDGWYVVDRYGVYVEGLRYATYAEARREAERLNEIVFANRFTDGV